jgi:XRE family transcriptional regulator, fatty acid utilization regulator
MAVVAKLGKRVRRLRESLQLTQVEMAKRLNMSASYLNLIEHDQRPLTLKLLLRLGEVFDVDLNAFSESEEGRVVTDVAEVLVDPVFRGRAITQDEVRDVVGASPDLARAVLDLYRAYRSAREEAGSLGEELRNREVLAGINYEFRDLVASIRSFAEILQDNPDLDVEQRRRFTSIILENSKRLVPLFSGLLNVDRDGEAAAAVDARPPAEDVADFLQMHASHFPGLEDAAEEIRRAAGIDTVGEYERLASCLAREHGIIVRIEAAEAGHPRSNLRIERGRLDLPEMLSLDERSLAVAKCLALVRSRDAIARCADAVRWPSAEARDLMLSALADYVAEAVLMPYERFQAAAREFRYDLDRLQRRFCVGVEQVCRRLTSLQRPGARGIPFHLLKVDMAGNVLSRFSASGIRIPRYGGICSLWNVHAAFLSPGMTRAQVSRMPDGTSYFSIARTVPGEGQGMLRSHHLAAIELGCEASLAADIVYADGLDLRDVSAGTPVGPTCRLCERPDCRHRVLPPFRRPAIVAEADPVR